MLSNAWTYTVQDALAHYGVSEESGLDEYRARENAKLYGKNGGFDNNRDTSCQS
jgi:Ca2+ transporting ATPase